MLVGFGMDDYGLFLMGIQQEHFDVADRTLEKLMFFCTSLHPDNRRLRGIKSGLVCRKSLISPKLFPFPETT
jgi:hypothetical protein